MPVAAREVHLVAHPEGMPQPSDFAIVDTTVPDAGDGEIRVLNLYNSIDPATRPRLSLQPLDTPPWGFALGRVEQSRHPGYREGDIVHRHVRVPRAVRVRWPRNLEGCGRPRRCR